MMLHFLRGGLSHASLVLIENVTTGLAILYHPLSLTLIVWLKVVVGSLWDAGW